MNRMGILLWQRIGGVVMVRRTRISKRPAMTDHPVPHFHNDPGVPVIEIGAKEFMCIGATPPFDHPHVFCDMGSDNEFICSYCSTLYRHNPKLHGNEALPAECAWLVADAA
jgi:uncharacterized Zn-finger protein